MDYKSLKVLDTVIAYNNFQEAAYTLHMTQSAVSQRIKQLEVFYGEPLLVRTQPLHPTELGEKLLSLYKKVSLLEVDFEKSLSGSARSLKLSIAMNRDSIETWFQPIFSKLANPPLSLDIFSDDQEITLNYLKRGLVIGAVSTQSKPLIGCQSHFLGFMDYLLVASPEFKKNYFKTVSKEALLAAPAILFDNKDRLHEQYLKQFFKLSLNRTNCHLIPSVSCFKVAALNGLGYGLIPELDIKKELKSKLLINLLPKKPWRMTLYWHHFTIDNKTLNDFNKILIETARKKLSQT